MVRYRALGWFSRASGLGMPWTKITRPLVSLLRIVPTWALILLIVGGAIRVLLTFSTVPVLWPDSLTYLTSAKLMADEGNYWLHEIYRTPMYPLFLSYFVGAPYEGVRAGEGILTAQRLFGLASGFLLFLTLRRAFSAKVALWGAVLFLTSPLQLFYETSILTEAQFILFLALFLWLAGRLLEDGAKGRTSYLLCITLGLSAAVLSLSRPIGQLLLLVLLAFSLVRFGCSRRTMTGAALSLAVFAAGIFPWMKVNHDRYGFWGISRDFGINMFHRVLDVDDTPLPEISTDRFVRERYIKVKPKPGTTYFHVYYALLKHLKKKEPHPHFVKLLIDQRMGDFALEVLMAHPYHFIPNSLGHFWRLFVSPRPSLHFCNREGAAPYLCSNHPGVISDRIDTDPSRVSSGAKRFTYHLLRYIRIPDGIFALFAFIGIIVGIRGPAMEQRLFLAFTIAYFTGLAALFNCPEDRFRLPVDGLIFAFTIVGLLYIVRAFRRLISGSAY